MLEVKIKKAWRTIICLAKNIKRCIRKENIKKENKLIPLGLLLQTKKKI